MNEQYLLEARQHELVRMDGSLHAREFVDEPGIAARALDLRLHDDLLQFPFGTRSGMVGTTTSPAFSDASMATAICSVWPAQQNADCQGTSPFRRRVYARCVSPSRATRHMWWRAARRPPATTQRTRAVTASIDGYRATPLRQLNAADKATSGLSQQKNRPLILRRKIVARERYRRGADGSIVVSPVSSRLHALQIDERLACPYCGNDGGGFDLDLGSRPRSTRRLARALIAMS